MKRFFVYVSMTLMSIFAISCQKEIATLDKKPLTLSATLEEPQPATKTSLGEGNNILWSEGDAISVFTSEQENVQFSLTSGAGTASCKFSGPDEMDGTPMYAIYPYNAENTIDGSTITFTLPQVQNYVEGSFDNGANVAVAQVNGTSLAFKNTCGMLSLSLRGSFRVSRIVLSSDTPLVGKFSADASAEKPSATLVSDGTNEVTLLCDGVQLMADTSTEFYFVLPVGALENGFTATIYDMAGDSFSKTISTTADNKIKRSFIKVMDSRTISHLSSVEGVKEAQWLSGTGDAIIDSKYAVNEDTQFDCRVLLKSGLTAFGTWKTGYQTFFCKDNGNKVFRLPFANLNSSASLSSFSEEELNSPLFVSISNLKRRINNVAWDVSAQWTRAYSEDYPVAIMGGIYTNGTQRYDCMKAQDHLYYLIISEKNVVKRYFIPCVTTSQLTDAEGGIAEVGTTGLYDLANGVFYTKHPTLSALTSFGIGDTFEDN